MQNDEEFAAGVTRDVRAIEAMSQTLFTLELIHHASVTIDDEDDVVEFGCQIETPKAALGVMGADDD